MMEKISPSGNYKTKIIDKNGRLSVEVYEKREDYDYDNDTSYGEYWSRITERPIFVDSIERANIVSLEHIRNSLGEPSNNLDIDWIMDYLNSDSAKFLDYPLYDVFFENHNNGKIDLEKIIVNKIICIDNDYVLIREEDGCYLVGKKVNDSKIVCRYYVDNLKTGLKEF